MNGKKHNELRHSYDIVNSIYDVTSGQAARLQSARLPAIRCPFRQNLLSSERSAHSFSFHLVPLAQMVITCGSGNDRALRQLMILEKISLQGDSTITFDTPDETKHQLQVFYRLSKNVYVGLGSQ